MIRNKKLQELDLSLNSLIVFRRILVDPVIVPLRPLLDTETTDPIIQLRQYAEFTSRLFPQNMNLTEYLLNLVLEDDNFFMRMIARGEEPDDILQACVRNELSVIQRLATLKPVELMKEISYYGPLPEWKISKVDFAEVYFSRLAEIGKFGYGHFAKSTMFTVNGEKTVPVLHPDPIRLSDLFGYEAARNEVIDNTRENSSGKSSTVKALVNEFASEGLRLIQITKEQLPQLPCILDSIYDNPLKFILFLDDLSFAAGDDSFGALKAILEGSVSAMPENAVFYATSNRRHIIRERFSDRGEDEIHPDDTVQEQFSLSERFGLRVCFAKPSKQEYLDIVLELAKRAGVSQETDALCMQAEQFALRSGGRSPRTAKQFIASLA